MPNTLNQAITREYEVLLADDNALFVQPVGLSVEDNNAFRTKLDEQNLRMHLLKGSLARRVLEARGLSDLDGLFIGPAAIITADPEAEIDAAAIAAAKVVAAWRKESGSEFPGVKGGLVEGILLDEERAGVLKNMPGRDELLSRISGQIIGPAATLAAQFIAAGGNIAGAVKSHIDKLEKEAG